MLGRWVSRGAAVFACTCVLVLLLASTAVAAGPASFSNVVPAAGSTPTVSAVTVGARAADAATITAGSLRVDGALITSTLWYPVGHWVAQGCDGYWVIDDYSVAEASAPMNLADGSHEASFTVTNANGETSVHSWGFTVGAPPVIDQRFPTALVETSTPTLSARVTDNGLSAIELTMTLDGSVVPASFETSTGILSYTPGPLAEGTHTVVVTAMDAEGFSSSSTWSFPLRIQAHMAFSSHAPSAGSTVTVLSPPIGVSVDELYSGVVSASATLNGAAVPVSVSWPIGHWVEQGCDMYWVVDDNTVARVNVAATLPDGVNTVAVTVRNADGFSDTTSWSFGTAVPPVLSAPVPTPDSDVATLTPAISAALADNDNAPEQVEVRLDGSVVTATVDVGGVSLVSPKLKDDTTHTVSVSATDAAGLNARLQWSFRIEVLPDMTIGACTDCHEQATHPMYNCTNCHDPARSGHGGGVTRPVATCNCHGGGQHSPFISWMNQCTNCHQPPRYEPYVRNHPVPLESVHSSDVGTHGLRCTQCHNRSLTREHNRYKDGQGAALHCATCHGAGASQRVKDAVAAANTDCYACHEDHDHRTANLSGVAAGDGNYCLDCHDADLVWEHGAKSTSKGYGKRFCDDCHPAGRPWSAPITWDRSCDNDSCHGKGSAHPMHSTYCQGCHQNENSDFSGKQVDFSGMRVTKTKCLACHGTGITNAGSYKMGRRWVSYRHLSHNATDECAGCHYWEPRRTEFYTHTVKGAYGFFASVDSTNPAPARAHSVHVNGSWAAPLEFAPQIYCGNCHKAAGCGGCHASGALPTGHADHGTQPTVTVSVTPGAPSYTTPRVALKPETRSCAATDCHGSTLTIPTCTGCHTERATRHW